MTHSDGNDPVPTSQVGDEGRTKLAVSEDVARLIDMAFNAWWKDTLGRGGTHGVEEARSTVAAALQIVGEGRSVAIAQSYRDPAIIRAASALHDLRHAMQDVRQTLPHYMPGTEPSAADNCRHVLDMIEHGINNIAVYLEVP